MKILSCNVRGLGGVAKWKVVRGLVTEKRLCIVCIQETKLGCVVTFYVLLYGGIRLMVIRFVPLRGRREVC
jgi:hypothetical protein